MWSEQMKQSGWSTTRNIRFQVKLKMNMKFKDKTELLFSKQNKRCLVNVNDLLIKFSNSGSRERQSQHLTGSYRWNIISNKMIYSFVFDQKIDKKMLFNWFENLAGDAAGAKVSRVFILFFSSSTLFQPLCPFHCFYQSYQIVKQSIRKNKKWNEDW